MKTNINKINVGSTVMVFLIVITVIGLIAMSGCIGGGGGDQQKQPSGAEKPAGGEQPAQLPAEENKPAAKETKPASEETKTGETVVDKAKKSLSDIFNLGKPQGYTVSYDMTGKDGSTASKMTLYFAGEKKIRMDTMSNYMGESFEGSIFLIESKSYLCTKTQGEWVCFTSESGLTNFENVSKAVEKDLKKPVYDGTQNIAGVTAECYKLEVNGKTNRFCVHTQKYLMLLTETYAGGKLEYRMIATSVDLSMPKESVFILPAEPQDISSMMGGSTPPSGEGGNHDGAGADLCASCDQLSGDEKTQCREAMGCP